MSNIFSLERAFSIYAEYGHLMWSGLKLTLFTVFLALAIGGMIAVPLAFARNAQARLPRLFVSVYITVFRGTPFLVQVFLIYFGLAQFELINATPLWVAFSNPLFCAILALSLNTSAYLCEVLRGGLGAISKQDIEAADVIGLSAWQKARLIQLPQAIRFAWGPIGNETIYLLKTSALLSTITVLDLMGQSRIIASKTFAPLETYVLAAVAYYATAKLLASAFKAIERRWSW